ncbi:hypothetical protein Q7P37_008272 [Cladosporium fusiforme]
MSYTIKTRLLIISDTHGEALLHKPSGKFDVAIHCGDMTEESKLEEFKSAVDMLREIDAPLKLVIAGNHDISLDTPVLKRMLCDNTTNEDANLVKETYGDFGGARGLFSPPQPKKQASISADASWAYQYLPSEDHTWEIEPRTDVVITHSPPQGVLDYTSRIRAGSASLFAAVARSQSRLHCFGHIHSAWGAKVVTWRSELSENPSHFTDIDNDQSHTVETIASLTPGRFDSAETMAEKASKRKAYDGKGCCEVSGDLKDGQTVFVNAAIEGPKDGEQQHPWAVEIDLPCASA